jgi:hypothetical protein
VDRLEQLPLSIIRQVLLHQGVSESTALPTTTAGGNHLEAAAILLLRYRAAHRIPSVMANGTRLEAAGILRLRWGEDPRLPPVTANGTRLEAAGILLLQRRAANRVRGRVAQPEPGMARATKHRRTTSNHLRSRGAWRPDGRQIAG